MEFVASDGLTYTTLSEDTVKVGGKDTSVPHNAAPNTCPDSINIPETVSYNNVNYRVTTVGSYAFFECKGITSISISQSVTDIQNNAFDRLNIVLDSVELPQNLISIGSYAFTTNKITKFNIPASLKQIGNCPFGYNYALKTIDIDRNNRHFSVNDLGLFDYSKRRFIEAFATVEIMNLPDTVMEITDHAFACVAIKTLVIPIRVTKIKNLCVACNNLVNVYIYGNIKSCSASLFQSCSYISNIYYFGSRPVENKLTNVPESLKYHVCEAYKGKTLFGSSPSVEFCYSLLVRSKPVSCKTSSLSTYHFVLILITYS